MNLDVASGTDQPEEARVAINLDDPALYLNRELSWLEFNDRVLAEALDGRNLLLDRVRFLAITASNLDEFFGKRVGWLKRVLASEPRTITVDGLAISEQLEMVIDRCVAQRREMDACWRENLGPALVVRGIRILPFAELDLEAQQRLQLYFEQAIFPVLTPLVVDPSHPFPFISSGSLSLALNVRNPATGHRDAEAGGRSLRCGRV